MGGRQRSSGTPYLVPEPDRRDRLRWLGRYLPRVAAIEFLVGWVCPDEDAAPSRHVATSRNLAVLNCVSRAFGPAKLAIAKAPASHEAGAWPVPGQIKEQEPGSSC